MSTGNSNADEWGIAMCWLALREKTATLTTAPGQKVIPAQGWYRVLWVYLLRTRKACVRSFQQWRTGCCQEGSGKGGGEIYSKNISFQHCWHVLDMLPSLTITYSEPRVKSNFHPSDSCWIVLHSQSYCLHLYFPRNYYPGIIENEGHLISACFQGILESEVWPSTCNLMVGRGPLSTLPRSVTWDLVTTVSGHRIRLIAYQLLSGPSFPSKSLHFYSWDQTC